MSQKQDKALL